jgi:predicted dithiol-disulfide oxidoreductase (DUF899 family)
MQTMDLEHAVVSETEWIEARIELLKKEKQMTRLRDDLSRQRRELPWRKVEKKYLFDTVDGKKSLADLFDGRSQLLVKHFMFGPEWKEGCVGCSFEADHTQSALVHLQNHDVSYVAVARAPLPEIEAFKKRMGWSFPWVSSYGGDFNYDFHVSFTPEQVAKGEGYYNYAVRPINIDELSGRSAFYRNEAGEIFHTYSSYGRGTEELLGTYMVLDIMPKGRNETGRGDLTDWVRHHDRYDAGGHVAETGRYVAASDGDGCCHPNTEAAGKSAAK